MKKILSLLVLFISLTWASHLKAEEVTLNWNNPGSVVLGTGYLSEPTLISLDNTRTSYNFSYDSYIQLCIFPAEGYVLTEVSSSLRPGSLNSITANATYGQQTYYGIGDSFAGSTINIKTEKLSYDGNISVNVINGAEWLNAYFETSESIGEGQAKYTYAYQKNITLADKENSIPFSNKLMSTLFLDLKRGAPTNTIYKVTVNGETKEPAPYSNGYKIDNLSVSDKIEVRVFEGEAPVLEKVNLKIDYPKELEGCVMNIYNRTTGDFINYANGVFTMPENHTFTFTKGDIIRVNFNEGYTLTKFLYGSTDVTDLYSPENRNILLTVNEDATLSISGEVTQYNDIAFTAFVVNPDGLKVTFEKPDNIANPIKDVTGQQGEVFNSKANVPSFKIGGDDNGTPSKTIPGFQMNSENTLTFNLKVSERRPLIFLSPMPGYYIESVWNDFMEGPLPYIDGRNPEDRSFYVVVRKLERDQQFIVEKTGSDNVSFHPSEYFQMNWGNPSISFAVGEGTRTYDYNVTYDNPFTLTPYEQYAGFSVTLNGRQTGITVNDNGQYIIDFTKAYETSKYPVPTLKITGKSTGVENVEDVKAGEGPVFNLQGVRINGDWENLPAGIYIRDGKKIIKK